MQLSLPTPTVLLFLPLLLPFQTLIIAAPGPAPAPAALEARITVAVTIPNFSSGAVVQAPSGDTRIYYQTNDGAVHELGGIGGSPDTSRNSIYNDITLFRPGKARKGSPLAAINLDFNLKIVSFPPFLFFFFSLDPLLPAVLITEGRLTPSCKSVSITYPRTISSKNTCTTVIAVLGVTESSTPRTFSSVRKVSICGRSRIPLFSQCEWAMCRRMGH